MANRITDSSVLSRSIVWVRLTYGDGSEFCFQTTLAPQILNRYGVVLEEGKLVRLDKQYFENGTMVYRQFPFDGSVITLWDAECYSDANSKFFSEFM